VPVEHADGGHVTIGSITRKKPLRRVVFWPVTALVLALVASTLMAGSPAAAAARHKANAKPKARAGYHSVLTENFSGTTLSSDWHPYYGRAGSDTAGWWYPTHVTVGGGVLTLRTYKDPAHAGPNSPWVEGGIDLWPSGVLTDGEYLVRSRVSSAIGVTEVMLLWPNNDNWPPEIDFNESNGTNESTAHLIYGSASHPQMTQSGTLTPATVNLTQWHTWGVIVTPTTVTYTVDGRTWASMANHETAAMHLAIQQQVWACNNTSGRACPSAATPSQVDMQIDWVEVLAPGPRHRR
jgi:beta-glucanase (GH16 family)